MKIRKAGPGDLPGVAKIYNDIHSEEEAGRVQIGWERDVYPTEETAKNALDRGDLFVMVDESGIIGTAIINQLQVDVYEKGKWEYPVPANEVMVLHTLIISPEAAGKGYGKSFVHFYEDYAGKKGCIALRLDTNARNQAARRMYAGLGYNEIGIVPTVFNGIEGVQLVLLEKYLAGNVSRETLSETGEENRMEWRMEDGVDFLETVRELFAEYTQMLADNDPVVRKYLSMQSYDDELAHLSKKYGRPEGRLYVAFDGKKPAGCIALRDMGEGRCEMKRLYVRPEYRKQGLGKFMSKRIIWEARIEGYHSMFLDTLEWLETAIVLYQNLGFYEIESYNDNPMDRAVYMRLDL